MRAERMAEKRKKNCDWGKTAAGQAICRFVQEIRRTE